MPSWQSQDPQGVIKALRHAQGRFEGHMARGDENSCWPWQMALDEEGYGSFRFVVAGKKRLLKANQVSYLLYNDPGPLPEVVRHSCDNAPCCNPRHLMAGTHALNVQDRVDRERSAHGERNGRAKLTEDDVLMIRRLVAQGETKMSLARTYGVDPKLIRSIVQGKIWKHLGLSATGKAPGMKGAGETGFEAPRAR